MKKALFFIGCALFVAAMASCGNKNAEETTTDSVMDTVAVADTTVAEVQAVEATEVADANDAEMLSAAQQAGQAKCNCYKKDPASVEACIKALLSQTYAAYQNNETFKAAMEKEYQKCVKEKVAAAATEATNKAKEAAKAEANKAVSAAAADLSKKLNKNN